MATCKGWQLLARSSLAGLSKSTQSSSQFSIRRKSFGAVARFPCQTTVPFCSANAPSSTTCSTLSRFFSTIQQPTTVGISAQQLQQSTLTQPSLIETKDGRQFAAFSIPNVYRKLKPYIVKRRLNRMRIYEGSEKNIRHSPWRLNLVCQLAAGLPLVDALQQLQFCTKSMAPVVQKVLIRTANLADIRDGLQHSQLEVAECFATKGSHLKRMKPMGRGRTGRMEHKMSHFRVVLREIDFKLKLYQAPSLNQKKKWFLRQQQAEADKARVQAEREELDRLERQAQDNKTKQAKN